MRAIAHLDPRIWLSETLSTTDRLALVYLMLSLKCPSGRGPYYSTRGSASLAAACGITEAAANSILRRFEAAGFIQRWTVDDGGPQADTVALIMPAVASYEL